jgi:hypothetical protein
VNGTLAVVSAPCAQLGCVTRNLAASVLDTITSHGRVYVVYLVDRRGADETFADPLDGVLLVECRYFDDETSARRWVASDIALRCARTEVVQ